MLHEGVIVEPTEEFQEVEGDRVMAMPPFFRISISHKGADEGEVYKGCNQPWISSLDRTIRINLDELGLMIIVGKHPAWIFGEWVIVGKTAPDLIRGYGVYPFKDIVYGEGGKGTHKGPPFQGKGWKI